jgi:putative ABC transport system permease protein
VDPVGQRIRISEEKNKPWTTIVGVVASQKHWSLFQEMSWIEAPTVFSPLAQDPPVSVSLAIRSANAAVPVTAAVNAMDSEVAVGELVPIEQAFSRLLAYPRFRAVLLGACGAFALLLAAIGLHGVLGQLVTQRTQEIGVRLALGARPSDVVRLVARHGGIPVLAGLALGLPVALTLSRFLAAFLYGTRARDPLTLAAASGTLLLTAVLAIALPARRAARTDPMTALRLE